MKIASWNVRGLNSDPRQKGVKVLVNDHNLDIIGLLETKLNDERLRSFLRFYFRGWNHVNNFATHDAGRIFVLWNPLKVSLEPLLIFPKGIHFKATCKVTSISVHLSFVYGLHSVVDRRPLWEILLDFSLLYQSPWHFEDFNNVLSPGDRHNGVDVTPYEIRDFEDFCLASGVSDLPYTGSHYRWTNDQVWSKIDRALCNFELFAADFFSHVNFLPLGVFSDHSACVVTIFQQEACINRSFKFITMWTSHEDFLPTVSSEWSKVILGTQQFRLCSKLKTLKGPLQELNSLHFSHIFTRAKNASQALESDIGLLQADPTNSELKETVKRARFKANFLEKAAIEFYSQKAKCSYLNLGVRGTKFFHALVKRNANKRHISAITLENGLLTTSPQQVVVEFVSHFQNLLGTAIDCEPIDVDILNLGTKVEATQASNLVQSISNEEIRKALFSIGDDKSPDPDGYTAHFFKKSWPTVGEQFCDAIKDFFLSPIHF